MGSIGRYIFRTTLGAFVLVLVSLTSVIWVTQALREFDLMTGQGQSILVFIGITSLIVPSLVVLIAPIALFIAVAHVLNKLGTDSEIIVMNAAGMSPWRVFRSFLWVTLLVAAFIAVVSAYFAPHSMRELRRLIGEARADLVSNIVQTGRFATIDRGLVIHVRERDSSGRLLGIFVDDRRDPSEHSTFLAEDGEILKNELGIFLILENGSVQRQVSRERDPTIVLFNRYAFDLSRIAPASDTRSLTRRERYVWELIWPDPNDKTLADQRNQFWAELNDRMMAPLYAIGFLVIGFAYLGAPRTTRQSRAVALASAIGGVAALRVSGFVSTVMSVNAPAAVAIQYAAFALALTLGTIAIARGSIIEMPASVERALDAIAARFQRRALPT